MNEEILKKINGISFLNSIYVTVVFLLGSFILGTIGLFIEHEFKLAFILIIEFFLLYFSTSSVTNFCKEELSQVEKTLNIDNEELYVKKLTDVKNIDDYLLTEVGMSNIYRSDKVLEILSSKSEYEAAIEKLNTSRIRIIIVLFFTLLLTIAVEGIIFFNGSFNLIPIITPLMVITITFVMIFILNKLFKGGTTYE